MWGRVLQPGLAWDLVLALQVYALQVCVLRALAQVPALALALRMLAQVLRRVARLLPADP